MAGDEIQLYVLPATKLLLLHGECTTHRKPRGEVAYSALSIYVHLRAVSLGGNHFYIYTLLRYTYTVRIFTSSDDYVCSYSTRLPSVRAKLLLLSNTRIRGVSNGLSRWVCWFWL